MKKFKATWQEKREEIDSYGDVTDVYFVRCRDVVEAENEDAAYKILCDRHPVAAEYGFDDIVESGK